MFKKSLLSSILVLGMLFVGSQSFMSSALAVDGINAHGEETGVVINPMRAEDALSAVAHEIRSLVGSGDVAGIIAKAEEGLKIIDGTLTGQSFSGTPLVRDMSGGKGIRQKPTVPTDLFDGMGDRNVVHINMKWQKFSIEADVDFVRVPVDANGNLQPWTAIYHVKVLHGHHSFIPTALPIMAPLPPPPPMPIPGQCDQIEVDLKEGSEYTVTVHYGEGQIGGDPAQSDSNVFGGYIWCGRHPARMIWFVTPVAEGPMGDGFLNMMVNGMLAMANGENTNSPEWDAKLRLDNIIGLASSQPVDFLDAIKDEADAIEDDMDTALDRMIPSEPGADITVVFRNNRIYGSVRKMTWSGTGSLNVRIKNEDPWPHFLMIVDFGEGEHNFDRDLGCSAGSPIMFQPLLMPPPKMIAPKDMMGDVQDFTIMPRESGVVGGSGGIYIFDFFAHSRMIWTVHPE